MTLRMKQQVKCLGPLEQVTVYTVGQEALGLLLPASLPYLETCQSSPF